jgi:succinate-acetate transporter protein
MATAADVPPAAARPEPPKYFQESASGVPLAVFSFGFSVLALSLANAEIFNLNASLFVPVAFGTGALGMLVGGIIEFRNGNLFGATFGVSYACFLFTTPLILRWFAPEIALDRVAGVGGFGDSFGAYLLLWAVFTAFLTIGAYYINLPAFLAFLLLVIVYVLVGWVNIAAPESNTMLNIAGWIGLADGACAWWLGMAILLNGMGPRPILPLPSYPYGRG